MININVSILTTNINMNNAYYLHSKLKKEIRNQFLHNFIVLNIIQLK